MEMDGSDLIDQSSDGDTNVDGPGNTVTPGSCNCRHAFSKKFPDFSFWLEVKHNLNEVEIGNNKNYN